MPLEPKLAPCGGFDWGHLFGINMVYSVGVQRPARMHKGETISKLSSPTAVAPALAVCLWPDLIYSFCDSRAEGVMMEVVQMNISD